MTNEALTILLQCGLFFIAFLELIIGLIDKFTKKIVAPPHNWTLLVFYNYM